MNFLTYHSFYVPGKYEIKVVYYISLASSNAYSVFNFNKLGEFEGNNNRNILFIRGICLGMFNFNDMNNMI